MSRRYESSKIIFGGYVCGRGTPAECGFVEIALEEMNYNVDKVLKKYSLCNANERKMLENVRLVQNGETKELKWYYKRFELAYSFLNSSISKMRKDWYESNTFQTFSTKASAIKKYEQLRNEKLKDYWGNEYQKFFNFKLYDSDRKEEIKLEK